MISSVLADLTAGTSWSPTALAISISVVSAAGASPSTVTVSSHSEERSISTGTVASAADDVESSTTANSGPGVPAKSAASWTGCPAKAGNAAADAAAGA